MQLGLQAANIKATLAKRAAEAAAAGKRPLDAPPTPGLAEAKPHTAQQVWI